MSLHCFRMWTYLSKVPPQNSPFLVWNPSQSSKVYSTLTRYCKHQIDVVTKSNLNKKSLSEKLIGSPYFVNLGRIRSFKTKPKVPLTQDSPSKVKVTLLKPTSDSPSLLKPFLFTLSVCGGSFLGCMIWNYENMRKAFQKLVKAPRKDDQGDKAFSFRQQTNEMWNKFDLKTKMILSIICANIVVFGLWRNPNLQKTMMQYFSSSIHHPLPSLVLSSFSHINFTHLFVNMYVLWNFVSHVIQMYGPEQFSAVYLSAGVTSAFTSIAASKLLKRPSIISVGASGAIMGLLGIVCITNPNSKLSIAFVDQIFPHSFSADTGMKAIICLDLLGLVLGWRVLDHAGHLGGMFFGILYAKYGSSLIWGNRESFMKFWHEIRGKP